MVVKITQVQAITIMVSGDHLVEVPLTINYIILNNGILKSNSSIFLGARGILHSTLPREYTD